MPSQLELLTLWYADYVKPFLDSYSQGKSGALSSELARLKALSATSEEVVVCFLGSAGVGKSTLINALVANQQVLPAGGIGPLTAQATLVRFSTNAFFRARYHAPGVLWRLVFPIEQSLARASSASAELASVREDTALLAKRDLDTEELSEAMAEAAVAMEGADGRYASLLKQAKMLIKGDQFAEAPEQYLHDCLCITLGRNPRFGTSPTVDDERRIRRLKEALQLNRDKKEYRREGEGDPRGFLSDLHDHTAGHLAPLLSEMEVGWPAELLRDGLVLVDLPGIGVANDTHRRVTQDYVRNKARALVVVVDRAGMTDAAVDLLRQSGYWDRVVGAGYEPEADPCTLVIAVTRVDDVVLEEYGKRVATLPKGERGTRRELFALQVAAMRERIRQQAADQLRQMQETEGAAQSSALAEARQSAREGVFASLQVFPVSAPEYRRVQTADPDDIPQIAATAEDTQIPQLGDALKALAIEFRARRTTAIESTFARLQRGIHNELAIVEAQWKEEHRAVEEADQLRKELETFLAPLREHQANRQGTFREFLQGQQDTGIPALVTEAKAAAEKDIRSYLRSLQSCHWATLKAAVRRGGTWDGARNIDLPNDIAARFQEPVAGVWGVKLLKDIRRRTKEYADGTVAQVQKVCDFAKQRAAKSQTSVLEKQRQRIQDQADQVREVGKEATDELRGVVKTELFKAIGTPIRKQCEAFVERGDHIGRGVKERILILFQTLAEDAAQAAEAPARRILSKRFTEVRQQIDDAFAEWKDPLKDALDAIASTHEQRLKRADGRKRQEVVDQLSAVRRAAPSTGQSSNAA